jgi:hypothetical protein
MKGTKAQTSGKNNNILSESLRILASLIAQSHIKKLTSGKKLNIKSADNGEPSNGQSLP